MLWFKEIFDLKFFFQIVGPNNRVNKYFFINRFKTAGSITDARQKIVIVDDKHHSEVCQAIGLNWIL